VKLYTAHSIIPASDHGGWVFANVRINWFCETRRDKRDLRCVTGLTDAPGSVIVRASHHINELMTAAEVDQLRVYLAGLEVVETVVSMPIPITAVPEPWGDRPFDEGRRSADFIQLSDDERWPHEWHVWGYFDCATNGIARNYRIGETYSWLPRQALEA
jgi:hypothetical protein